MRISLKGSIPRLDPKIFVFTSDTTIDLTSYKALGYTDGEVIVIGAGGGRGGGCTGVDTEDGSRHVKNYGGQGGGGGFHQVKLLLSALPDVVAIGVGVPGADGTDADNPDDTTDGEDGGASSFNETAAMASGGKGGKRASSCSTVISSDANGGDGGLGGITEAGWGAAGGQAGLLADLGPEPGIDGSDGELLDGLYEYTSGFFTAPGKVGKGGGGGAGGVGNSDIPRKETAATKGGRGSYNSGDESVFGPAGDIATDDGMPDIIPGIASGARVTPLNGTPFVYGKSRQPGVVCLRIIANV